MDLPFEPQHLFAVSPKSHQPFCQLTTDLPTFKTQSTDDELLQLFSTYVDKYKPF
jgi:hypothetical protein